MRTQSKFEQQYRWSIDTKDVFDFCTFTHASHLDCTDGVVSGFVRKSNVRKLISDLAAYGKHFSNFRLISSERFWKNLPALK
jgi:hypothetical protein